MKTIKTWSLCLCLLGAGQLSACACPSGGKGDGAKTVLKGKAKKEIAAFFAGSLAGDGVCFDSGQTLRREEVEACRAEVWQLWREANEAFDEEKLIATGALSGAPVGRWNLPDSLEPNAVMPYYWGAKGVDIGGGKGEGLPLFLYLHGSGSKDAEWATGLQICRMFDDAPSLYFIPQIPNEGGYYRWWQRAKQFAWEKLLRLSLASGQVDADRIYVFGISEGGYGSQRLASFYADYWAGAGPMAGGEPLKNAPVENCANTAFSLRTGAQDYGFYRQLLTGHTRVAFDSLQKEHPGHFVHNIELIPGMGHAIDYRPTTPWLKQHVRNPYPKFVAWENFEMDGRYRKGFYNLYVDERSNADEGTRTYYELDITGNRIDLQVKEVAYEVMEKDPQWGIELTFKKKYTPATRGKVTVYLCDELVDLGKEVTLTVNGKEVFRGMVEANLRDMVNSCAAFFDPRRVYPASIEVEL